MKNIDIKEIIKNNDIPFELHNIIVKDNIKYEVVSIQAVPFETLPPAEAGLEIKLIYVIEQVDSKHRTYLFLSETKDYKNIKDIRDENIDKIL